MSLLEGDHTSPNSCANAFGVFVDCSDRDIKGVIPVQATVGVTASPGLGIPGQIRFGAEWPYTDAFMNNVSSDLAIFQQPSVSLFNGYVRWQDEGRRWTVSLEGRNLAHKRCPRGALQISAPRSPSVVVYPAEPRMLSVRVGFYF